MTQPAPANSILLFGGVAELLIDQLVLVLDLASEVAERGDRSDGNQRGDQRIFDCADAAIVANELQKRLHDPYSPIHWIEPMVCLLFAATQQKAFVPGWDSREFDGPFTVRLAGTAQIS